jgi:YesN/AraC family two-component response regulator
MEVNGGAFWKGKKVLIVDDFEMVRSLVGRSMRQLQCERIDQAENGAEAFRKLVDAAAAGDPFDLVFSDWVMPVLDGLELFKKIRKEESIQHTPFVMFTVESDQQSVMTAVKTGIKHFMVKPVLMPKLVEKLKEVEAEIALEVKKRKYNV